MGKNRKEFLTESSLIIASLFSGGKIGGFLKSDQTNPGFSLPSNYRSSDLIQSDLAIIGGGTGGCAAALSALKLGLKVVITEPTDWLGGQLTSQGVPPDENPWIESFGASRSYQEYRTRVRNYYRNYYPLRDELKGVEHLNPGDGSVSRISHEPQVSVEVLESMFARWISNGKLRILRRHVPVLAETKDDFVSAVKIKNSRDHTTKWLEAPWFIDATEMGDLLKLGSIEYVTGAEGKNQTGELHAPEEADPDNVQAFNLCFSLAYYIGENHTIEKPEEYSFWKNYVPKLTPEWPGPLFSLTYSNPRTLEPRILPFDPENQTGWWLYRQILNHNYFTPGFYAGPISCINWPQHEYLLGNLIDETKEKRKYHLDRATQLNLSLIYWLQTEVPRPDGGYGWPGLKLRGDIYNSPNGMAKHPYIRESRRIKAMFTVLEQHVGTEERMMRTGLKESEVRAEVFDDSVGIGAYRIDLHPTTAGNNYIDISSLPFQIPLGALIPQRIRNLIPACKNIGTTHITNGCYRLHPVEWNIGESAGTLIAFCENKATEPHELYEDKILISDFQSLLKDMGVRLEWPQNKVYAL